MSTIALALLIGWALEGLLLGHFMGRRGYDRYVWTVLGFALGPIAVGVAVSFILRPLPQSPTIVHRGRPGHGTDVLVGVDGSADAEAAIDQLERLLRHPPGRLMLATVVPIDATPLAERQAADLLERARTRHAAALARGAPVPVLLVTAADPGDTAAGPELVRTRKED